MFGAAIGMVGIALCGPGASRVALVLHFVTTANVNTAAATSVACMNAATPVSMRGAVGGIGATTDAFGKGLGPVSFSNLFAWTVMQGGRAAHGVAFYALGVFALFCAA